MSEAEFLIVLQQRNNAMPRDEVEIYLSTIRAGYKLYSEAELPERYKSLDADDDGYISFDELLKTIDQYFDFQLDLNLEDEVIRETLVTHDGEVTHPRIRDLLGLPAEFVLPVADPEPEPEQPDPDSYELDKN